MTKVAIITDTHEGIRNDLECIREHQNNFWINKFFPECKKRDIKTILHLGDFFDKRQYLTLKTMENTKNVFISLLEQYDMNMEMITGNHDVLYRNTNNVNSLENLFGNNNRITVYTEPTEIINGSILLVPWINNENYEESLNMIKTTNAEYCFGHFEISGAELHKGTVAEDGLSPDIFKKFKQVFSGHFHTQSERKNIKYLGAPFQYTWNDFNDKRGWWIFDTETHELEYIDNDEAMFFKVEYNSNDNIRDWIPYKPESCSGKFIKVIVTLKENHYDFEQWLNKIQSYVPQELNIFDSSVTINDTEFLLEELEGAGETNIEIIERKIDNLSIMKYNNIEKEQIKKKINKLYSEIEV